MCLFVSYLAEFYHICYAFCKKILNIFISHIVFVTFNANKLINMFSMSIYVSDSLTLDSNHIMGFVHCLLIVVTMMCQCCSSPDFVWILHLHWYHQWWCTWLLVLMHCSIFCGCSFLSCFRWSFAISVIWCHHKASIIRKCIMHDLISLIHILC